MTIFYLDPEFGNDANNGLSFANRRKTPAAFTDNFAAGDEIRLIADYGRKSLGNATWTDNSMDVVLAAAKTLTIDNMLASTGWVASTNATVSVSSSGNKMPTALTFQTNGSFTTGLIAYKPLGAPLDLSAWQALSAMVYPDTSFKVGQLVLALCSDAAGATPVAYHELSGMYAGSTDSTASGKWHPQCVDNGVALPSGINSIAVYALVSAPNMKMTINNWIAAKAKTASDHLSHECIIGKDTTAEFEWYPILTIDGTTVKIGNYPAVYNHARRWRGIAETAPMYAMCPLKANLTQAQRTWKEQSFNQILDVKVTGGWNRTDMSTQTGTSWAQCSWDYSDFMRLRSQNMGWSFPGNKIGVIGATDRPIYYDGPRMLTITLAGCIACQQPFVGNSGSGNDGHLIYDAGIVVGSPGAMWYTSPGDCIRGYYRQRCFVMGDQSAVAVAGSNPPHNVGRTQFRTYVGKVYNNNNGASVYVPNSPTNLEILDGSLSVQSGAEVTFPFGIGSLRMDNVTWTKNVTFNSGAQYAGGCTLRATNNNGDPNDHCFFCGGWYFQTVADGANWGWQVRQYTGGTLVSETGPSAMPLAQIAVEAGSPVTFKAKVKSTNAVMAGGIRVMPSAYFGIASELRALISAAALTAKEELTLTFTPSKSGVIEFEAIVWTTSSNDTTNSLTFTDVSVTQ